jgi:hypothetical protein
MCGDDGGEVLPLKSDVFEKGVNFVSHHFKALATRSFFLQVADKKVR